MVRASKECVGDVGDMQDIFKTFSLGHVWAQKKVKNSAVARLSPLSQKKERKPLKLSVKAAKGPKVGTKP